MYLLKIKAYTKIISSGYLDCFSTLNQDHARIFLRIIRVKKKYKYVKITTNIIAQGINRILNNTKIDEESKKEFIFFLIRVFHKIKEQKLQFAWIYYIENFEFTLYVKDYFDSCLSRSQAKRLIKDFNSEIINLDFSEIEIISRSFLDEIFRVFLLKNPQYHIKYSNASPVIENNIKSLLKVFKES